MVRRVFLKYPCGKKFELKMPIIDIDEHGKVLSILPGSDKYFESAKKKFQINKLTVIEEDFPNEKPQTLANRFVSLINKIKSIH